MKSDLSSTSPQQAPSYPQEIMQEVLQEAERLVCLPFIAGKPSRPDSSREILQEAEVLRMLDIEKRSLTAMIKNGLPCTILRREPLTRIFLYSSIVDWLKEQEGKSDAGN